jgi:alpha-beta hydrolase superfamily lysophospholipase
MVLAGCVGAVPPTIHPSAPPRLARGCVVTSDGYRLPLSVWLPAAPDLRAVLVAVHGFNDYRRSFSGLARYLARQGVAVYAYDQRGFGATRDPGQWDGGDTLARDLVEVVKLVRQQYPDKPLYVLGDSMGAAVVMVALAGKPPLSVQGALLVAPAVWGGPSLNPLYRSVLWIAAHTVPWVKASGKGLNLVVTDNREVLKKMRADPLVLKEARLDALYGVVRLMDDAVAAAPRLHARLLVLYGERDQVIPTKAVCRMLVRLGAPHRDLFYGQGYHLLLRDREAPRVWQDIAAWLDGARPTHGGPPDCRKQRVAERRPALSARGQDLVGQETAPYGPTNLSWRESPLRSMKTLLRRHDGSLTPGPSPASGRGGTTSAYGVFSR